MRILYNFASRSRPERFFETLDNIINLSETPDFSFLVKIDSDDNTMINKNVLDKLQWYCSMFNISVCIGASDSKVHAINRDIPLNGWDVIVNMSDDMRFTIPGFDGYIRQHIEPDTLLHIPDTYAGSKLITMHICDRDYFLRDKYIYNPAYYSLWADNESMRVAQIRGRYRFVDLPIIEHLHYSNGGAGKDALYRRNDTYQADKQIYLEREANNFYL